MTPVSTAERPPEGLTAYWLGVWRHALKVLKEQGTWAWEQRPLLDEYVYALRGAEDARRGFAWLDHLTEAVASEEVDWIALRQIASGLPTQWDRHTKRASALADQLLLTARGRKQAGVVLRDEEQATNPFEDLDELEPRRKNRASAA